MKSFVLHMFSSFELIRKEEVFLNAANNTND